MRCEADIVINGTRQVKQKVRDEHHPRLATCAKCPVEATHLGVPDDPKRSIVVGDRVLIAPEEGEERTNVGLYLPPSAIEGRQVQGGRIVATGPGTPMAEPASMDEEPWKIHGGGAEVKYLPMQAEMGDYALFFRKAAVEITFEEKTYLVVPQAAILVLVRGKHG